MKKTLKKIFILIQIMILYFFNFIFKINSKIKYSLIIGVNEIANFTHDLNKVFKKESISVNLATNKLYENNKYDYLVSVDNKYLFFIIKLLYGPYLLAKLSNQSNIFIYLWWTGFCIDREIDYKFLKRKNKKIVCIFLGSDIRSHHLTIDFHNKNLLDSGSNYTAESNNQLKNEQRVIKVANDADKYADLIFNYPKDQMSYLKSEQLLMPYMYESKKMCRKKDKFKNIGIIKIVHAPSNPIAKGTPLVRAAIKKLTLEGYEFEYTELTNTPNKKVLEILQDAHILINEFYAYIPGVLAIEGMGNFCATITSAEYDGFPEGAKNAWFQTKYWKVYDNLKYLLDNTNKMEEYANNGYEFVKNNYTEEKVKEFYINTFYKHKIIDDKNIF